MELSRDEALDMVDELRRELQREIDKVELRASRDAVNTLNKVTRPVAFDRDFQRLQESHDDLVERVDRLLVGLNTALGLIEQLAMGDT